MVYSLTGVFHSSVNGTYVFHIYALSDGKNGVMLLKQNNDVICRVHVSTANWSAGACSIIVRFSFDYYSPVDQATRDSQLYTTIRKKGTEKVSQEHYLTVRNMVPLGELFRCPSYPGILYCFKKNKKKKKTKINKNKKKKQKKTNKQTKKKDN